MYELLLEYFREGSVHTKGDGDVDLLCGIFIIEFFTDFFKETKGCVDFKGAVSKTDKDKVLTSDDVICVSEWMKEYS